MSDRQLQLDDRDARTNGKSQVRPHPTTHGQTLLNGNETPVSFRMVATALNDHGDLTSDMCGVQILKERAHGATQDVLAPDKLTQNVQLDQNETAKVIALRTARIVAQTPMNISCPKDLLAPALTLVDSSYFNDSGNSDSESSKGNSRLSSLVANGDSRQLLDSAEERVRETHPAARTLKVL